jgi:hypothetical protein
MRNDRLEERLQRREEASILFDEVRLTACGHGSLSTRAIASANPSGPDAIEMMSPVK